MIKNIISIGDSFTYGEELNNLYQAWPYLVGKAINADVVNLAQPAASNDKILRITLDYLARNNNVDLVLIGWSSPGRIEFSDELGYFDIWPGYSGKMFSRDNLGWRTDLLEYVNKYHNSSSFHVKFLQQTILLQKYLHSMNIKYIMVNVLENEYYKKIKFDGIQDYYKQIDQQKFLDFGTSGMIEWTEGCKKGPNGHFLDDGHAIVAKKIHEHLKLLEYI